MKGIVAEIHGSHMIVIAKNGEFIKCKLLPNCNIGEEILIPAKNMTVIYKRASAVAAGFLIAAMLSTGVYAYYTPYSYISVDINPSLELYVNRFDRVIKTHAFNEEATKLLEASQKVNHMKAEEAVGQLINQAASQGYLQDTVENSVMIVVSSNSKKEEKNLSDKVSQASTSALSSLNNNYEVILEKTKVETYQKSKEPDVSPGKAILADKIKEIKPEVDKEQIKHMPLQQAIKEIEDKGKHPGIEAHEPSMAALEKGNASADKKSSVKSMTQLIKEKNEALGKKLEKEERDKKKQDNKDQKEIKDKDKEKKDYSKKEDEKKQEDKKQDNGKQEEKKQDHKKQDDNKKPDGKHNDTKDQKHKDSDSKGREDKQNQRDHSKKDKR